MQWYNMAALWKITNFCNIFCERLLHAAAETMYSLMGFETNEYYLFFWSYKVAKTLIPSSRYSFTGQEPWFSVYKTHIQEVVNSSIWS